MFGKSVLVQVVKRFAPYVIVVTILCGLIYVASQQNLRQGANDPQIQMAEDIAQKMEAGIAISDLALPENIDVSKSLAPFLIVFSESGNPIASSAELQGKTPIPPNGVFAFTKEYGEDRITWQPAPDTRIAAVIIYYAGKNSGFVLAGRNLREIERREDRLTLYASLSWITILCALLITITGTEIIFRSGE